MTTNTLGKLRSMGIELDNGYDFLADTLERNRAESLAAEKEKVLNILF